MIGKEQLKSYLRGQYDLDLIGIADASSLSSEPRGHRPSDLLPGARSIIVFGRAFSDGAMQAMFRAAEDGQIPSQSSYAAYCGDLAPNFLLVNDTFSICLYLEDIFGAVAMPVPFNVQQSMVWDNVPGQFFADPYGQGMPLDIGKAAMAAGLGEFGWSNRFLTPQYGPRQMLSAIITTLDIGCDEVYDGRSLCDPRECGICAKVCPTHAIDEPESGRHTIKKAGGKQVETAQLCVNGCTVASLAFRKEFQGRTPVPDLIMENNPTDSQLRKAFEKKPVNSLSIEHYPRYFCEKCLMYCPAGDWKRRFGDTGLSDFSVDKL